MIAVVRPGTAELVVDGIRIVLSADGSFELGQGVLPLARAVQVTALPERLGGGVLFALSTPDNTWLLRSNTFAGQLSPIGRIDVPTGAVTPGFEAIYATIKTTGLVIGIDPTTGQASEATFLPRAPEYGSVAIVDDWFGAYADPLRGLMLTNDVGQHWRTWADFASAGRATSTPAVPAYGQIQRIFAQDGRLAIELRDQRRIWMTRDGNVPVTVESSGAPASQRSVRSWVQRWKHNELGGWPIELAVAEGALINRDAAAVVSRGRLARIRLRDGAVLETSEAHIAADQTCRALQAEGEVYFYCQNRSATSVHRWYAPRTIERLEEFEGLRDVASWSKAGVLLRGGCAAEERRALGRYCVVRPNRSRESIELQNPTGRERVLVIDRASVVVLTPPEERAAGRLSHLGSSHTVSNVELPKDCSIRQRRHLQQGYWQELPYLAGDELGFWVVRGDELMGVRVTRSGRITLGEIVGGAARAMAVANRILIPDSSGFALESKDGGMTYVRPPLPVPIASTLGAIPHSVQFYGCSPVGCRIGNWLRIGWANPHGVENDSELEPIAAPNPIRLAGRNRRVPRVICDITADRASTAWEPAGPAKPKNAGSSSSSEPLGSTVFRSFYGQATPHVAAGHIGFDRGWRDERVAVRAYARAPLRGGGSDVWQFDVRVSDPLRRSNAWSVQGQGIRFDSIESAARAFAHPRYGERASNWSVLVDPGGDGALWTVDDAGKVRGFLLEPGQPIIELTELVGRVPRRITDVARLRDGWYLLGTDPEPWLIAVSADGTRLVSDFDPRSQLNAARLRMVRNRDQTRVGYLVMSARLRAVDVEWFVYPIEVRSGSIEAPIVVPLARGIRPCDSDEDGWLFATSLDWVADVALTSSRQDISGRTQGLLRLTASGICIDRVLVNGMPPQRAAKGGFAAPRRPTITGNHLDEAGRLRAVECQIVE